MGARKVKFNLIIGPSSLVTFLSEECITHGLYEEHSAFRKVQVPKFLSSLAADVVLTPLALLWELYMCMLLGNATNKEYSEST